MRVLWFTPSSANYHVNIKNDYNGGGWIVSLESQMRKLQDIELGVSFFMDNQPEKEYDGKVTYYPMPNKKETRIENKIYKIFGNERKEMERWTFYEQQMLRVVDDFKPDIIEVFGSESPFGLIANRVDVPVVLHLQGILNPCMNAYLPPFVSWRNFLFMTMNIKDILKRIVEHRVWLKICVRELEIFHRVSYYLGRTTWDERVVKLFHNNAYYYYGSEILRPFFYNAPERKISQKFRVISIISSPLYKGYDMALKTAKLMKEELNMDFEWFMYGNINSALAEKMFGIRHESVNIRLCGVASAEELCQSLLGASAYAHTSYIDNSPNSLCEAQILGVPAVVTNVGGVSSLIEEGVTGFVVPANDPYQMAYLLHRLSQDKGMNIKMGNAAKQVAKKRHNPSEIIFKLTTDYRKIINEYKIRTEK